MKNETLDHIAIVKDLRQLTSALKSTQIVQTIHGPKKLRSIIMESSSVDFCVEFRMKPKPRVHHLSLEWLMRHIVNDQSKAADKLVYVRAKKTIVPWDESLYDVFHLTLESMPRIATQNKWVKHLHAEIHRVIKNIERFKKILIEANGSIEKALEKETRIYDSDDPTVRERQVPAKKKKK